MAEYQTFDLIQEIDRNDGTSYYELGNIYMNGVAERCALDGYIKQVRIVQLNIPHGTAVRVYEEYINENYEFPSLHPDHWEEWAKPEGPVLDAYNEILRANHIA